MQDIQSRIMVTIQNHTTTSTDVRANRERLLARWCHSRNNSGWCSAAALQSQGCMQEGIAVDPLQENPPASIMDRLGELAITNHILDLKMFIGNQVVRRDERVCLFSGKIFTLPLNFQMLLGNSFSRLLPVRRFLLFARESSLEPIELRLRSAVVPGVLDRGSLGVSQEALETDINPNLFARGNMFDFALGIDAELAIVSIGTSNNTNTLDDIPGEGFDTLFFIPNQPESANATAISEDDMPTVWIKLPAGLFVLNRSIVVLKSGIALLSRLLVLAILIEARDSRTRRDQHWLVWPGS